MLTLLLGRPWSPHGQAHAAGCCLHPQPCRVCKVTRAGPHQPLSAEACGRGVRSTIYNMCTQKPPHDYSEDLYARYKDAFVKYITEKARSSAHGAPASAACVQLRRLPCLPCCWCAVQRCHAQAALQHPAAMASGGASRPARHTLAPALSEALPLLEAEVLADDPGT